MAIQFVVCLLALHLTFPPAQQDEVGAGLYRYVQAIEGRSNSGRRDFIKAELKKMNVSFTTVPFDTSLIKSGKLTRIVG